MNRLRILAGTVLATLLVGTGPVGRAEDLQAGKQYAAGVRVHARAEGVSFELPAEWFGGVPVQGSIFLVGSNTRPGLGMIIMRQNSSWQDIDGLLNQPQDLGEGVVLMPTGPGRRTDRGYEIELSNGLYTGYAIGRIGEAGNGIVLFFGGPRQNKQYYQQLVRQASDTVQFNQPQVSGAQQQWQSMLAGMMLKRMSSYYSGGLDGAYVGGSSSESLHLCSDGSYAYFSSSSVAADGGMGGGYNASGYGGDSGAVYGQWSLEAMGDQTLLTLQEQSGAFSQHSLQFYDGKTTLDGDRVYRVQSDRCR